VDLLEGGAIKGTSKSLQFPATASEESSSTMTQRPQHQSRPFLALGSPLHYISSLFRGAVDLLEGGAMQGASKSLQFPATAGDESSSTMTQRLQHQSRPFVALDSPLHYISSLFLDAVALLDDVGGEGRLLGLVVSPLPRWGLLLK
jgi:hypothetical protein